MNIHTEAEHLLQKLKTTAFIGGACWAFIIFYMLI